ncbi:unnamed protein product [Cyprideis torosa]|uniref:Uronate isomerase n=1 Tax=Cyprideis torosa TaxID=163714 RepID=A0A7R8ZWP3_9CRUS|nr:unnamed protein product [Cyprideis torosa]CAG0905290.1 unnamed protein product [Cyprideis torosa]
MQQFLSDDFLLQSETAKYLYHEYAKNQPIFDYHCHLPVQEIAADKNFPTLTSIWLYGDHYKWRAMRANGIDEALITGNASDREKFQAWAETVPQTLRNPLYHWTHLELKNPFGIKDILLSGETAEDIYTHCGAMLSQPQFSACGILKNMNVRVVCTTDDPIDNLEHHRYIAENDFCFARVIPTFRPDKAMAVETGDAYRGYLGQLEAASDTAITTYKDLIAALRRRHQFFHDNGCRISDHGIGQLYALTFTQAEIDHIFDSVLRKRTLSEEDTAKLKTSILLDLARMGAEKNWVQQFHFGALRDTNTAALQKLGPDTGFDSMGDFQIAVALAHFLDTLAREGNLGKTVLYNLNPRDNELFATMAGNYQDGSIPGKIQFGAAWWFNDQKEGIERQLNALSNMGLLSRFVGMLTDSRSFLSYPRHEYFRRILCNLFGNDVENGELPNDTALIGKIITDICYTNAQGYFAIDEVKKE